MELPITDPISLENGHPPKNRTKYRTLKMLSFTIKTELIIYASFTVIKKKTDVFLL